MPVKNLLSIGKIKPIPIYIYIPPEEDAMYKITVERKDGTIDDITNLLLLGETNEVTDSINDKIGSFTFTLDNSDESRTNIWEGNETLRIYLDYDTTATTLRFRGRVEKVNYPNNQIVLVGRSEALDMMNIYVNYSTTDETSNILKYLLNTYATRYTQSNINVSTKSIAVSWVQKTLFECIQELCNASAFDFYVDCNLDVHYFESGSVENNTDCAVHNLNIFSIDDFGKDYSVIKNRVIVQGGSTIGLPIVWTAESEDESYGVGSNVNVKEYVVKDQNLTTIESLMDRADAELLLSLNPHLVGECEAKCLATLQPGEKVFISAPYSNIEPQKYTISQYKHKFMGITSTILTINKEPIKIQRVLKNQGINPSMNAQIIDCEGFKYSLFYDFSQTSEGTFITSRILNNILVPFNSSSGTWFSPVYNTRSPISSLKVFLSGDNIVNCKVFVSLDGGTLFTQLWGNGANTDPEGFNIPTGRNIQIRIDIADSNTQIKGVSLLYNT